MKVLNATKYFIIWMIDTNKVKSTLPLIPAAFYVQKDTFDINNSKMKSEMNDF